MKIKADDIVAYADSFHGRKFVHAGRSKDYGVDCSGLAVLVFNEFGADISDKINYSMWDGFVELTRIMLTRFNRVKDGTINKADLLLFRAPDEMINNHIAIVTEVRDHEHVFIHSYNAHCANAVVYDKLDGGWRRRLMGVYRYKEIVY